MSKLVLGTVQFGLQYGVNSAGRPSEDAVRVFLQKLQRVALLLWILLVLMVIRKKSSGNVSRPMKTSKLFLNTPKEKRL